MIKFFRKVRHRFLLESKFSRYLLYAVGEIILVVIGILIAIQIDTWRTEKRKLNMERNYLLNLVQDLKNDSIGHVLGWVKRYEAKVNGLKLAKDYYYGYYIPEDSIAFMNAVGKGGIGSIGGIRLNDKTFRDLINTGNIGLIRDDNVRNQISNYYTDIEFAIDYLNNLRSPYSKRVNSLRPFNPLQPNELDNRDINLFFKSINKPDMIELINLEITYGNSANQQYKDMHQTSLALKNSILKYLKYK